MPKLVNKKPGKIVTVWISADLVSMWAKIDNKSAFVQLALQDAVGIMTWGILKKERPEEYHVTEGPLDEILPEFNKQYPVDKLTAQRLHKQKLEEVWPENSAPTPELW